ncbi:hypothetical protein VUR80DRAFT_8158 [Thermomyces stellatus]
MPWLVGGVGRKPSTLRSTCFHPACHWSSYLASRQSVTPSPVFVSYPSKLRPFLPFPLRAFSPSFNNIFLSSLITRHHDSFQAVAEAGPRGRPRPPCGRRPAYSEGRWWQ